MVNDSLTASNRREFNIFSIFISEMTIPVLRLLTNFLVASQLNDVKFHTIIDHLMDLKLNDEMETSMNRLITDGKIKSQSIVDLLETSDDECENYAIDILLKLLIDLLDENKSIVDLNKIHEHTCKTLCLLLNVSPRARQIANDENVIVKIVQQMEDICDEIGMNCQNFVRKHGNAKVNKGHKMTFFPPIVCTGLYINMTFDIFFFLSFVFTDGENNAQIEATNKHNN